MKKLFGIIAATLVCWCGLIPEPFHFFLTKKKKKKTNLQIAILENIHNFLMFLKKMKEKKLPNEYKPLFIPKGI